MRCPEKGLFKWGFFMHKLYVLLFCLVVMLFVYFAGMHAGYERATRKISTENTEKQTQIIKIQENVNEDRSFI
jgi:hypothetical protein